MQPSNISMMGILTNLNKDNGHDEMERLEKLLQAIEKRIDQLETSNNLAHGVFELKADAILEDTDKIRRVVEPTDTGF